jgi:translocator protein
MASEVKHHSVVLAGLALLPVVIAAGIAQVVTIPNIPTWYAGLAKPWFSPPNWLFGPVWTLLYLMMAVAFYRILRLPTSTSGRTIAIAVFLIQISLNTVWSQVFFGLRNPQGGLFVVIALLAMIGATIAAFGRLDKTAAWLLVPYFCWVSFATILNFAIYQLN